MTPLYNGNLRSISRRDFALLLVENVAYVKPALAEGTPGYAIHAADGTQMGWAANREVAFAAIIQNGLEPVSVH